MEARTSIDDSITILTYYFIAGASFLMDTMHKSAKKMYLDKDITPEAKKALKQDLNFSSQMIAALGEAQRSYKQLMRSLDIVEAGMNTKLIDNSSYDYIMGDVMQLTSFSLIWQQIANGEPENEKKIFDFMKTFPWSPELTRVVTTLRNNSAMYRHLKK